MVVQTRLNIILCYKMWNNLHQMSIKVILVTVTCLNREQNWSPEIISIICMVHLTTNGGIYII